MAWNNFNTTSTVKKVNPDDFVDASLKHAQEYKFLIAQKFASNESVNIDKFKQFFIMLVNDAEGACTGCKYIVRNKEKFEEDKLTPEEVECLEALRKYFRSKIKVGRLIGYQGTAEIKAREMLREAIEGTYDAKLNTKREELFEKDKTYSEAELLHKNFELANYRFQLLLEAITSQKAVRLSLNA